MNSTLLSIGIAIVLALFAALLAPFFVDWNAYKGVVEERLSAAIGQQVSIKGDFDARILPVPVLRLADVEISGAAGDFPLLTVPAVEARVGLTPLLKGEIEVQEIDLGQPIVTLTLAQDGTLHLPVGPLAQGTLDPGQISVDAFEVIDGTIVVTDANFNPLVTLTEVNLTGNAVSLRGPFKAQGTLLDEEDLYAVTLATGRARGEGPMRLKATLRSGNKPFALFADGEFTVDGAVPVFDGDVRLSYGRQQAEAADGNGAESDGAESDATGSDATGSDAIEGNTTEGYMGPPVDADRLAWSVEATLRTSTQRAAISKLNLSAGPAERAISLGGVATAELYPRPKIEAVLTSTQIDFDRFVGGAGGAFATPAQAAKPLLAILQGLAALPVEMSIGLDVDAVLVNGALIEAVGADLSSEPGRIAFSDLRGGLPGSSQLAADGALLFGQQGTELDAVVNLESANSAALAEWAGLSREDFGALFAGPRRTAMSFRGAVKTGPSAFAVRDATADLGGSELTGSLAYEAAAGGGPASLAIDLASKRFDLGRYLDAGRGLRLADRIAGASAEDGVVGALAALVGGAATTVRFKADEIVNGEISAAQVAVDASLDEAGLSITALRVGDLAGTSLSASGYLDDVFGDAAGELTASLQSPDLVPAARMLAGLGLGDPEVLEERAAALGATRLKGTLAAQRGARGTIADIVIEGSAGGTQIDGNLRFEGRAEDGASGRVAAKLSAENASGAELLGQLGLALPGAASAATRGRVNLELEGPVGEMTADAFLSFAGLEGEARGQLRLEGERPVFSGPIKLASEDLRPLATFVGLPADRGAIAGRASGNVLLSSGEIVLGDVEGQIGANLVSGELQIRDDEDTGGRRIDGEIDLDTLSLPWLFAALFGEASLDGAAGTGEETLAWPRGAFETSTVEGLSGNLDVLTRRLILPGEVSAGGATFELRLNAGETIFDNISASLSGGRLTGRLAFEPRSGSLGLSANLALADAAVEQLVWASGGSSHASGKLTLSAQVAGQGRSWLGLMSSLNGNGAFRIDGGAVRGLDPVAFEQIIAAADAGLELEPERVGEVFRGYLAAGALDFEGVSGVLEVNDGLVSVKNVTLNTPQASVRVSSLFELPRLRLDSEWTMTPLVTSHGEGASPAVTVRFDGPIAQPRRRIDVGALTGYLTVRKLEQDVKRLEEAEAAAKAREERDRELLEGLSTEPDGKAPAEPPQGADASPKPTGASGATAQPAESGEPPRSAATPPPPQLQPETPTAPVATAPPPAPPSPTPPVPTAPPAEQAASPAPAPAPATPPPATAAAPPVSAPSTAAAPQAPVRVRERDLQSIVNEALRSADQATGSVGGGGTTAGGQLPGNGVAVGPPLAPPPGGLPGGGGVGAPLSLGPSLAGDPPPQVLGAPTVFGTVPQGPTVDGRPLPLAPLPQADPPPALPPQPAVQSPQLPYRPEGETMR